MSKPLILVLQLIGLILLAKGGAAAPIDVPIIIAGLAFVVIGGIGFRKRIKPRNESHSTGSALNQTKAFEAEASKECPYCAEIIKAKAKICRFCRKDLIATEQK